MRSLNLLSFFFAVGVSTVPAVALSDAAQMPKVPPEAMMADVVFLGEQHDNPAHHALQAEWVKQIKPSALVFEMLTPEQADRILPEHFGDAGKLEAVLQWEQSGWPDFTMYYPIFASAPSAAVFGAGVPPEKVRGLMRKELAEVAGDLTEPFGLDQPLPEDQQAQRESLQMAAHCDALPESMLPTMVDVQRLRDAALADAAIRAAEETGGVVVVITGNGHARDDWGAPFLLGRAAPELSVFSLGQGEAGRMPEGGFASTVDGPPVDRGDPCEVFRNRKSD